MKNPLRGDLVIGTYKNKRILGAVEQVMNLSPNHAPPLPTCSVRIILPTELEGQSTSSVCSKLVFLCHAEEGSKTAIIDNLPQVVFSLGKKLAEMERLLDHLVKTDKARMP